MTDALIFFVACLTLAGCVLLVSGFKARGWWVCDCGTRFTTRTDLDTHINECEGK